MKETLFTEMTSTEIPSPEVQHTIRQLLVLGEAAVRFARVERAPRLPDGRRETDVEHSFHLGLSATELAAQFYPDLDTGLVAEFSNVHDLPELYTGDVWTYGISDEARASKEAAEAEAIGRLLVELPPHTAEMLRRYEEQTEPEARFVRYVDKALPAIINLVAGDASTFLEDYNIQSPTVLRQNRHRSAQRFQQMFPEFPLLHEIRRELSIMSEHHFFPTSS
jgi:putative hydrolase of HD superfamily